MTRPSNSPLFYIEQAAGTGQDLSLDEDTSRHVSQVLRMKSGERVDLTDGKGHLFEATIVDAHKKRTIVTIGSSNFQPPAFPSMFIAISLIKNSSRFEWFLEKACELGIAAIYPLLCERTEKQHLRVDRMRNILVSAMLQSRQSWLPELHDPLSPGEIIKLVNPGTKSAASLPDELQKFIAHCEEGQKQSFTKLLKKDRPALILIGPEGDFTRKEIDAALENNFLPVMLGDTRLRTETAGMAAAVAMKL